MGYAPYTRITTPPNPATSGTVFTVQEDTGDRFPATPFTALTWHDQMLPTLGLDAEELTILTIDGDVMTCARGSEPIAIASDAQLAVLFTQSRYNIGELIFLAQEFPATDTNASLVLRTPQGEVGQYGGTILAAGAAEGGSSYSFSFAANGPGQWYYRWSSDERVFGEQDFYVRFSEVY